MMKRFFFLFPLVALCAISLAHFPAGDALAEDVSVENDFPAGNVLADDVFVENAASGSIENAALGPVSRETSWPGPEIDAGGEALLPFRCPVEKIRMAYEELANPDDLLMVMAVEKQILAVCRQTQQALLRIGENDIRLRELFRTVMVPPSLSVSTDPQILPVPESGSVSDESGGLAGNGTFGTETAEVTEPAPVVIRESEFRYPDYAVAAIIKGPAGWKAMLVDGGVTYVVRPGDQMNNGGVIVDILETKVEMLWKDRIITLALE